MPVGRVCAKDVLLAERGESVRDAARRMLLHRGGALVVVDADRRPVGLVTDRDVIHRCIAAGRSPDATRIDAIMASPPQTIAETMPIEEALTRLSDDGTSGLVVVDGDGRVVGTVSLEDILEIVALT